MRYLLVVLSLTLVLTGCADREGYYNAVKEQNMTLQLKADQAQRQREQDRTDIKIAKLEYKQRMLTLGTQMALAVAKTPTMVDDVVVPLMFSVMLDRFQIAEMLAASNIEQPAPVQLQTIEAPEQTGDIIAKSTGLALGVVGVGAGIWNNQIHSDTLQTAFNAAGARYTVSGENNKMNVDAFKSGSNNTVTAGGDSTITGGDTVEGCGVDCEEEEEGTDPVEGGCGPGSYESDGTWWTQVAGCSCDSCSQGHCGDITTDCPGY